jgi:pimeloyl-ACP methyl ester carboxylesterase
MITLVLLHPFPLSSAAYAADAAALAGRMNVLTPDLRGFGDAPAFDPSEPPSIDTMADDVARMLAARGREEPVVVGGHSMGGYVALALARRHPERLRGLILADTRAEADSEEARKGRAAAIARVESGDASGFVEGMLEKLLSERTRKERPDVVASVRAIAARARPEAIVACLRALRDRPDATAGLGAIDVPTLVVVGREDVITPVSAAETLARGISGAQLHVIPDAGHLSNLEQPEAFRSAVAAFVGKI